MRAGGNPEEVRVRVSVRFKVRARTRTRVKVRVRVVHVFFGLSCLLSHGFIMS